MTNGAFVQRAAGADRGRRGRAGRVRARVGRAAVGRPSTLQLRAHNGEGETVRAALEEETRREVTSFSLEAFKVHTKTGF